MSAKQTESLLHREPSVAKATSNGRASFGCKSKERSVFIDHYQYLVFKEKEGLLCSNPSFGFINAITDILVGTEEGF